MEKAKKLFLVKLLILFMILSLIPSIVIAFSKQSGIAFWIAMGSIAAMLILSCWVDKEEKKLKSKSLLSKISTNEKTSLSQISNDNYVQIDFEFLAEKIINHMNVYLKKDEAGDNVVVKLEVKEESFEIPAQEFVKNLIK